MRLLTRYPDWQTRFHQCLLAHLRAEFKYGTLDCCLFACDAVLAMTGTDLAAEFRGRYASRAEAIALIHKHSGLKTLRPFISRALESQGLKSIPMSCAHRGDLVLVQRGSEYSLGLVGLNGNDILAMAKTGYLRFPLECGRCAWRV